MEIKKGILAVVSGFSGSGKGTLMKRLIERYPGEYALSVSATTRAPRPGEEDGREYFFVSAERFEEMISGGELLEYARYSGNYYGTPKAYVLDRLAAGIDVILEIEVQGARKIKEQCPDSISIFVMPPSFKELERRLQGRGTESPEAVRGRLLCASRECCVVGDYDYLVINDDLDECVSQVHSILRDERARVSRNGAFIDKMRSEFAEYAKGE